MHNIIRLYWKGKITLEETLLCLITEAITTDPEHLASRLPKNFLSKIEETVSKTQDIRVYGAGMNLEFMEKETRRYKQGAEIWKSYFDSGDHRR
jgi:hypothetical protein